MKPIDLEVTRKRFEKAFEATSTEAGGLDYDLMYIRQVFLGMGRHFDLSPSESMLLALVHTLSKDGTAWCYMGQKGLGKAINISSQTVGEIVARLGDKGLLDKGPKHQRWSTNQWRLSSKALDRLKYLQDKITKKTQSKRGYRNQ